MAGRICELTTKPDGAIADESITYYDEDAHRMNVRVELKNGKIPVDHNNLEVLVNSLSPNETEVVWNSDITLKTMGKVLYPVLRAGLNKNFNELLEELKYYVETGTAHPRKQNKN